MHFNGPFLYRSSFHAETEEQEIRARAGLSRAADPDEGPTSFAAIILESVPGTAGIMVPPPGYMAGVREICDRYGIVFIADEVMAGFGRTGKWFAIEHFDVVPDLMTFAKGVTSGYVPLGGVAINDAIDGDVRRPGLPRRADLLRAIRWHCAAPSRPSTRWRTRAWWPTPPASASRCSARACASWPPGTRRSARSAVSACSGRSSWSPTSRPANRWRPTADPARRWTPCSRACKSGGLLPFANFNRIHAVPPCNVTDAEVAEGLTILDAALDTADQHLTG